ncbi:MAG: hypothetical protein V4805_11080 [Pseudomonadota bacterium]
MEGNMEYQGDGLLHDPSYDPDHLFDTLIKQLGLKNDAVLSRVLEVAPPVISKMRHRTLPIGATLLIRMHEESGLSILELRRLMGDYREKFGSSSSFHGTHQATAQRHKNT